MTARPARATTALWHLLAAGERADADVLRLLVDDADDGLEDALDEPHGHAWRHALAARRALLAADAPVADAALAAAGEALEGCPPSAGTALLVAYLAHLEVAADHADTALLLAVDASLLAESPAAAPSRELVHAHRWLALALAGLDLEELAVEHAAHGRELAARLAGTHPDGVPDHGHLLLLSAQTHAELAQTLSRQGDADGARELAETAVACATEARELADAQTGWAPEPEDADLLDVVQAWALTCAGDPDAALAPLRRVRRHVQAEAGVWLRGIADLTLARTLVVLARRDEDLVAGEEGLALLVDATGAFAAAGDRRRYRECLLELGRDSADLGRPGDAVHWLEAYRTETGRATGRSREMWAEMFVRRSRLREAERHTAMLRRHALEDPLTGLGNRRSAERRLAAVRTAEQPLSLAVVDVDRFKEVNDEASHLHGDAVLRRVADLLRRHSRTGDEVFRWAGDEFLVVLPTATEAQAVGVMERLRTAVAGADWSDLELAEPVTVSIGVATAPVDRAAGGSTLQGGWRHLFRTADLHLFSAKRGGRNRVRAAGLPPADSGAEGT